jgi:hypothetical protein
MTDLTKLPTMRQIERQVIFERMTHFRNNKVKVAESLGLSLKTLYNKLNRFEMDDLNARFSNPNVTPISGAVGNPDLLEVHSTKTAEQSPVPDHIACNTDSEINPEQLIDSASGVPVNG